MELLGIGVGVPAKGRCLEGEDVLGFNDFADSCPGSGLFVLGKSERAAGHVKQVGLLLDEVRQDSAGVGVVLARVAKYVVLFAVPMQINAQLDLPFLTVGCQLFLNLVQVGVKDTRRLFPPPVQVHPSHVAPEVTQNHSVDVHHREHFDHKVLK